MIATKRITHICYTPPRADERINPHADLLHFENRDGDSVDLRWPAPVIGDDPVEPTHDADSPVTFDREFVIDCALMLGLFAVALAFAIWMGA